MAEAFITHANLGDPARFVIYAYDPEKQLGGVLNDKGIQVPDFNHACIFSTREAAHLLKENTKYHTYILQLLY